MSDLYTTGVRQIIDDYLIEEAKKERDYGDYWSGSSAGYCMKKNIFERLKVPHTKEPEARLQRVFTSGHLFHDWIQDLTKKAGVSESQELELIDEKLMVKGHYDDIVTLDGNKIVYDYKTANSRSFEYKKSISHFHRMQLGTYMYILRQKDKTITEGRILILEKDTLMTREFQLLWTPELEKEVVSYWTTLNGYWSKNMLPKCTCADHEGGFMAKEKFNPFYYNGEPCSSEWYNKFRKGEAK